MATKTELYVPQQQHRTIWFMKEGDESDQVEFWVKIRADLLNDEIELLTWPDKDENGNPSLPELEEIRERLAPFVVEWNVGELKDGKVVKVDPPAKAGGTVFENIPEPYTWRIFNEVKLRNMGMVKADFLPKSRRSAPPTPGGNDVGGTTSGKA